MNEKKILIIGSSACAYSLAKKMNELDEVAKIYVAPGSDALKDFCEIVDIREYNVQELLDFALENSIDLTIVTSELAIKNDIATIFQQNGQIIFAPTASSASICLNKSWGKKFMYKNKIPCPRFAVIDKVSSLFDYLQKLPVVIKADEHQDNGVMVCNSYSSTKRFTEDLFDKGEKRVIIEDYIYGHEFSFYVITDGYHALPLGTVATYKSELEGDGGFLTSGMGAYSPDYKVNNSIEQKVMRQIVYPALNNLASLQTPYVGILGVDLVVDDYENIFAIEFNPFFKTPDIDCILPLLTENIYNLFLACGIGSFADDYGSIAISDHSSASCVIKSRSEGKIIEGLDDLDEDTFISFFNSVKNKYLEYETVSGRTLVLTRTARILSKALADLYEEVSVVKFDGKKYRRDIGKI